MDCSFRKKINQNKAMILPANMTLYMETVHVKSQQQKGSSHFTLNACRLDFSMKGVYLRFDL